MQRRGLLIILSSPSGAGKSTLARRLMAWDPTLRFSVSATTRAPRPGETDGVEYLFTARDEFARMVDAGEMLEHAEVFQHRGDHLPVPGALGHVGLLGHRPLAIVLEVGLHPAELVEVVVALALEGQHVVGDDQLGLGEGVLVQLVGTGPAVRARVGRVRAGVGGGLVRGGLGPAARRRRAHRGWPLLDRGRLLGPGQVVEGTGPGRGLGVLVGLAALVPILVRAVLAHR